MADSKQALQKSKDHTRDDKIKNETFLDAIKPNVVDSDIGFHNVGGLQEHIDCLREMVVFPMIYGNVFEMFNQHPAKGVIFHGPPGTGKTLLARALANEYNKGGQKLSFFMHKGADILSQWIGQSERQLASIFEKAKEMKPSIIFFDELDGLVPVRSSKQDQVHNSIVTTMLAMMDGLENRGDVIVIGATNRIDSIDPALRRPGRFDKELYFHLPTEKDRLQILRIIVSKWKNPPADTILIKLSEETVDYTGADLNYLCSESVLQALKRTYPQIYKTSNRLQLDSKRIQVQIEDFEKAMSKIVPSTERNVIHHSRNLPSLYRPLHGKTLEDFISYLSKIFPELNSQSNQRLRVVKEPRLLVYNLTNSKNVLVIPAVLHHFENCYKHTLSCVTLYGNSVYSPEEAIVQIFKELPQHLPAILFIPNIGELWNSLSNSLQKLFLELLNLMDVNLPILTLATTFSDPIDLPKEVMNMFTDEQLQHVIPNPSSKAMCSFYSVLLDKALTPPAIIYHECLEELPIASVPKLSEAELKKIICQEENTLNELRIILRDICAKLVRDKQFVLFTKPVDVEEVPDYLEIIKAPMDLGTVMNKIDKHSYICVRDFLVDIDLIVQNALEYNSEDKYIRHNAYMLEDKTYAYITAEIDSDFKDICQGIRDRRIMLDVTDIKQKCDPVYVHTIKKQHLKMDKYVNKIDESSNNSNLSTSQHTSTSRSPITIENSHQDPVVLCNEELIFDRDMFYSFINKDVMKFWDERNSLNIVGEIIEDGVIDLFVLLDNIVGQYLQKWDRSSLIIELKQEFEEFKDRYVNELKNNQFCSKR